MSSALSRRSPRRLYLQAADVARPRTLAGKRSASDDAGAARRCAVAGVVFAALLCAALVLVDQVPSLGASANAYARFYANGSGTVVTVGVYLVPFAGIAFLWFMFALRELLDDVEPRRSKSTTGLQLAAGVGFVCLLFTGTAAVGSAPLLHQLTGQAPLSSETIRALSSLGYALVFLYGVRLAGMFMITTTKLLTSSGLLPAWLRAASYLTALVLLLAATYQPATLLVLPAWTLVIGLTVSIRGRHHAPQGTPTPSITSQKGTAMTTTAPVKEHASETAGQRLPIPGPAPKPLIGNARDVDPAHTIESAMDLARRFGPIYRLKIPGAADRIIVSGPEMVAEVCDPQRFDKLVTGGLAEARRDPETAGLFTAETQNPLWRRAHNILLPSFSQQGLRDYHPMMVDIAEQMMSKWSRLNPGEKIDVSEDMTRLTLDTIALCGFSYRFNSFNRDTQHPFVAAMVRNLTEAQTRSRQLPIARRLRFRAARQMAADNAYMDGVVDEIIAARRLEGGEPHNDLLQAMLEGIDRQSGERLPDVNIRAQCITFLIAGHETTSGLLTFAVHFLLKHPEVVARAQREVDEVLGADPRVAPSAAQVRKLTYVTQILEETLRLWPTAPGFSRYPLTDTTLGDRYFLDRGASVIVLTPMLHRDRSIWGEDAEQFDPDHFAPERRGALPPYAFYPFGSGERACIGRQFAMQEATLVLGMMLQRFDLVGPTDYQLQIKETLTIKPDGLTLRVRQRDGRSPGGLTVTAPPVISTAKRDAAEPRPRAALAADAHGTPLLVLYGSNLGAAEQLAGNLAREATARGFHALVATLDDRVGNLPNEGAVIMISSSYNGTPPDNASAFCHWITDDAPELTDLQYAVFGCGSRDWAATYQAIPTLLDDRMQAAGARSICPRGEGDAAGDFEAHWEQWSEALWPALTQAMALEQSATVKPVTTANLTLRLHNRQMTNPTVVSHQAQPALVASNRVLYQHALEDGSRSVRHIEVALPEGATYQTGDHLGVIPRNRIETVQRVMRHFALDPGLWVEIDAPPNTHPHLTVGEPTPLLGVLACSVELQSVASRADVAVMAEHTSDEAQRAHLRRLSDSDSDADAYADEVVLPRRSLIDLLEAHPGCRMPFEVFLSRLPGLRPRYYSISSSPLTDPDTCSVTVGVRSFTSNPSAGRAVGVCSGYLESCDAQQTVFTFLRRPSIPFHPPHNPHIPMIMVAAGTGLAPFRGFLQERASQQAQGVPVAPSMLLFGCRDPDLDYLYAEELTEYERRGLVTIVLAPSQAQDTARTYVQDVIEREADPIHALLDDDAHIYVCGDAHRMAPAVRQAFQDVVRRYQGPEAAEQWLDRMRSTGRYLEDIWGNAGR